jgi:hypothetical protein
MCRMALESCGGRCEEIFQKASCLGPDGILTNDSGLFRRFLKPKRISRPNRRPARLGKARRGFVDSQLKVVSHQAVLAPRSLEAIQLDRPRNEFPL